MRNPLRLLLTIAFAVSLSGGLTAGSVDKASIVFLTI